jgi:hypothetical protein
MARDCPFKCDTVGLPHSVCRDWREGNVCYVEDLTRAPGYSGIPVGEVRPPYHPLPWPPRGGDDERWCREAGRRGIAQPYVNIYKVKSRGGVFDDKYRVYGSVEGVCLAEAGYFENGYKRESIPVAMRRDFGRYEFEIDARADRYPEIRVYNAAGDRQIVRINPDGYYDGFRRDRYAGGPGHEW